MPGESRRSRAPTSRRRGRVLTGAGAATGSKWSGEPRQGNRASPPDSGRRFQRRTVGSPVRLPSEIHRSPFSGSHDPSSTHGFVYRAARARPAHPRRAHRAVRPHELVSPTRRANHPRSQAISPPPPWTDPTINTTRRLLSGTLPGTCWDDPSGPPPPETRPRIRCPKNRVNSSRRWPVPPRVVPGFGHPEYPTRRLGRQSLGGDHRDRFEPSFGDTTRSFNRSLARRATASSVSSSVMSTHSERSRGREGVRPALASIAGNPSALTGLLRTR